MALLTVIASVALMFIIPWVAATIVGKIVTIAVDWSVEREFNRIDRELGREKANI